MQHIDGLAIVLLVTHKVLEVRQQAGDRLHVVHVSHAVHQGQEALAHGGLGLGGVLELEGPGHVGGLALVLNGHVVHVVGAVHAAHVHLQRGVAHRLVPVLEKRRQQVHARAQRGRVGKLLKVAGLHTHQLRAQVRQPLRKGLHGKVVQQLRGSHGHVTVGAARQGGQGTDGGLQVLGHLPVTELVGEAAHGAQQGGHELGTGRQGLVGHGQLQDGGLVVFQVSGQLHHGLVLGLALKERLHGQEALEQGGDGSLGLGRGGELLDHSLDKGLHLVGVAIQDQGQGVSGARQVNGSGGLRCNVQGASKVADLLHLGRVLELQASKQVTGADNGARAQLRGDDARLGCLQGHNHLHGLHLHVGLTSLHLSTRLLQVAHNLASDVRAQLGGVVHGRQQDGLAVQAQAQSQGLLLPEHRVGLTTILCNQGAVWLLANRDSNLLPVDRQDISVRGCALHGELVLGALKHYLSVELVHRVEAREEQLALLQHAHKLGGLLVEVFEGACDDCRDHHTVWLNVDDHRLLTDETVQPRGVDGVLLEGFHFQQLNQVLHRGADLAAYLHLLQCKDKALAGILPGGARGEDVTKLGVSVLVDATVGTNAEIAPDVSGGLELDTLNLP
mmetsp:Transcript_7509/g.12243  ORF Transcript_7509/g.12243 Transcript_7509/m.12243 type:complete len:616 (+) Transcript_7509:2802-4649(+)